MLNIVIIIATKLLVLAFLNLTTSVALKNSHKKYKV